LTSAPFAIRIRIPVHALRAAALACGCALQLACSAAAVVPAAADAAPLGDSPRMAPLGDSPRIAPLAVRPRIALVLSGGGARGFAHIGVLRVLRELHVPVDLVVGTSMGSVVGGAYAAGASVADLERMARDTDWEQVVADRPARDELAFRRREEDVLLPSRIEFGVHRDGLSAPPTRWAPTSSSPSTSAPRWRPRRSLAAR
jgi:NTE family protein